MKWAVDLMESDDMMGVNDSQHGGTGFVFNGVPEAVRFIDNFRACNPLEPRTYYFIIRSEAEDMHSHPMWTENWDPEWSSESRERAVRSLMEASGEEVALQQELFRNGPELLQLRHRLAPLGRN